MKDPGSYYLMKEHLKRGTAVKFKNSFYPVNEWLGWVESATFDNSKHKDYQWEVEVYWDTGTRGLPRIMNHASCDLITEHEDGFADEQ